MMNSSSDLNTTVQSEDKEETTVIAGNQKVFKLADERSSVHTDSESNSDGDFSNNNNYKTAPTEEKVLKVSYNTSNCVVNKNADDTSDENLNTSSSINSNNVVDEEYGFGRQTTTCDLYGNASCSQVIDIFSDKAEFYFKVFFVYERGECKETGFVFESGQRIKEQFIVLVVCYLTSIEKSSLICVPAKWFDEIKSSLAVGGLSNEVLLTALSENTFLFSCTALHELLRPRDNNNSLSMNWTMPQDLSKFEVSDHNSYNKLFSCFRNDDISPETKADRFALLKLVKAVMFASNQVRCYVNESLDKTPLLNSGSNNKYDPSGDKSTNLSKTPVKELDHNTNNENNTSNSLNNKQRKKYTKNSMTTHLNTLKQVSIVGPPRGPHNAGANIVLSERYSRGKLKPPLYIPQLPPTRKPAKKTALKEKAAMKDTVAGVNAAPPEVQNISSQSTNVTNTAQNIRQRGGRKQMEVNQQETVVADPVVSNNDNSNQNNSASSAAAVTTAVVTDIKSNGTSKIVEEVMAQLMPFLHQIRSSNSPRHSIDHVGLEDKENPNLTIDVTRGRQQNVPTASRNNDRNSSNQYFSRNHTISREITPLPNKDLRRQKQQSEDDDINIDDGFSVEELQKKGFFDSSEDNPDVDEDLDPDHLSLMKSPMPESTRNSVLTSRKRQIQQLQLEENQQKIHYVTDENGCVYQTTLINAKPVGFNPAYFATTMSTGETRGGNKNKNKFPRFVQPFSAQQSLFNYGIQPMNSSGAGVFQFREDAYCYQQPHPPSRPVEQSNNNDFQSYLMSMALLNKNK